AGAGRPGRRGWTAGPAGLGGRARGSLGPSRHSSGICRTGGKFSTRPPGPGSTSHNIPPFERHRGNRFRPGGASGTGGYVTSFGGRVVKGHSPPPTRGFPGCSWSGSCGFSGSVAEGVAADL